MERFKFSENEINFIESFNKKSIEIQRKEEAWSSTSSIVISIKGKIKDFLLKNQNKTCCYCKMYKDEDHKATWDTEHILPKKLYPQFTFTPNNLALACKGCNGSKNDYDTWLHKTGKSKSYPTSSNIVSFYHPHIDKYEDHLQVIKYGHNKMFHIVQNNSKKGKNTFVACNLFRYQEDAFGQENLYQKSLREAVSVNLNLYSAEELLHKSPEEKNQIMEMAIRAGLNSN